MRLGSILRAVFGSALISKSDQRMREALAKLDDSTTVLVKKPTISEILDQMAKERH